MVEGRPGPLQGGGDTVSNPLVTSTVPPPEIPSLQRGAERPSGHQLVQRIRTSAEAPRRRVTTGQPAGFGDPFALHPGGDELNVTPELIGFRFPFIRVMVGLP